MPSATFFVWRFKDLNIGKDIKWNRQSMPLIWGGSVTGKNFSPPREVILPCQTNIPDPEVIKNIMLNSAKREFFLLFYVKMPTTIVGILTFMSRKNSILALAEHEKSWIFLIILYL